MVGRPCNGADAALIAHIWQVAPKQRTGLAAPPFQPGVSTHSQTKTAKTEHSNPEMTHLLANAPFFTLVPENPPLRVGRGTLESEPHPPSNSALVEDPQIQLY